MLYCRSLGDDPDAIDALHEVPAWELALPEVRRQLAISAALRAVGLTGA